MINQLADVAKQNFLPEGPFLDFALMNSKKYSILSFTDKTHWISNVYVNKLLEDYKAFDFTTHQIHNSIETIREAS